MEQRLCSPGGDFSKLAPRFVCVRLYYTLQGATAPFAKLGLGDPKGPRNNVDLAFLAPDGRNLDVRTLKPVEGESLEGRWVRDIVAQDKNAAGDGAEIVQVTVAKMAEIAKLYPAKRDVPVVPWQVSLAHGVFVSAWDSQVCRNGGPRDERRIVVALDPDLERELEAVLKKLESRYVFVRLDPKDAPEAWPKAGLLVLESARSVDGFGAKQTPGLRLMPKVAASASGPWKKGAVGDFLEKHAAR